MHFNRLDACAEIHCGFFERALLWRHQRQDGAQDEGRHDDDVPDVLVRHRALGRPPGTRARADVPRADADVSGCDAPAEDRAPAWVRGVLDGL